MQTTNQRICRIVRHNPPRQKKKKTKKEGEVVRFRSRVQTDTDSAAHQLLSYFTAVTADRVVALTRHRHDESPSIQTQLSIKEVTTFANRHQDHSDPTDGHLHASGIVKVPLGVSLHTYSLIGYFVDWRLYMSWTTAADDIFHRMNELKRQRLYNS